MSEEIRSGESFLVARVPAAHGQDPTYLPSFPYPGIDPFGYEHRNVFFARSDEILKLTQLVVLYRGVLLYSDSGIGKSSLLNAGVIPRLENEGYQAERIRVQPVPGEEIVVYLSEQFGEQKITYRSIFTSGTSSDRVVLSVDQFLKTLRSYGGDLRPVLVFDQFEEWCTLFEEAAASAIKLSQDSLLDAICWLINDAKLPVKVLLSLREDYLAKLNPFFELCPNLPDHYLRLVALDGEQVYEAIRGPFDKKFSGRFQPELSAELAGRIQQQFKSRSAGSEIRLTEVQIVCDTLYRSGDPAKTFDPEQGVQKILERYLKHAIESLPPVQQDSAIALLTRMVTPAGTRNIISEEDLCSRVENEDKIPRQLLQNTLKSLESQAKLIRREKRREVYYYEIASEFLVRWIGNKAIERKQQVQQRKVEEAQALAELERQRAKGSRIQAKKLQGLVWALSVLLILAFVAMVFAFSFYQRAVARARQLVASAAYNQAIDPELSVLIAANAVGATWPWGHTILPEALDELHQAIIASHVRMTLTGHAGPIEWVAWSPDGKRLATGSGDKTAKIWDAATGKELLTVKGHTGQVNCVSWSPNGKRLATASDDGTAKVWDAESGNELLTVKGHTGQVNSVDWSPDGTRLATGSRDRTAKVWDAESGAVLLTLKGHADSVWSVAWSPDSKRLATGSRDNTAKVWNADTGEEQQTLRGHTGYVYDVSWSPNGMRLATASDDQTARVWEAKEGRQLLILQGHTDYLWSVAWSPDGKRLATASGDQTIREWEADSGRELQTLVGHSALVASVAWSPDGKWLASASDDRTAKVWDAAVGKELLTLHGHAGAMYSLRWAPRGKRLIAGSENGTAKVWDAESGEEVLTLSGHAGPVLSVAWSSDGGRIATGGQDKTAKIWNAQNGELLTTLSGHTDVVWSVAWSPDGKRLATAGADQTARVWDAKDGKQLLDLQGQHGVLYGVAWSPDGKRLATASEDQTARVWDAENGNEQLVLRGHEGFVYDVAWSPDGSRLATGSQDQTAKLWDTRSGKELLTLPGQTGSITSLAWSADGKQLVTGSLNSMARVWNAANGNELLGLRGHIGYVRGVAWSPDGKRLATAGSDGLIQVFAIDLRELMELAKTRVTAHPSEDGCKKYMQVDKCPPVPNLR